MTSRILVADDSPTIQKIVALAFANEDIAVEGVANGKEAWEMLGTLNPDIVMADVELPGMSGFELSRKIKSSAEHQKRWVLLLSSDFEEFDNQAFEACAAEDHLSKPFKSEDIVSKVQKMLSGEGIPNTLDIIEEESTTEPEVAPFDLSADDMEDNEPAPTFSLSADDMENPDDSEAIGLSPDELINELLDETPVEEKTETEPAMQLSADDMTTDEQAPEQVPENEEPETVSLSEADLTEPAKPEPEPEAEEVAVEAAPETEAEEESEFSYLLTDDHMSDFDESTMPPDTEPAGDRQPEAVNTMITETGNIDSAPIVQIEQEEHDASSPDFIIGEPRRDPDPAEDLEHAFQAVSEVNRDTAPPAPPMEPVSASSDATPDLIQESQAFLAKKSGSPVAPSARKPNEPGPGFSEEHMTEAMVQHAARVLEAGLDRNLKKELSGISEQVNQVVREVVQEMAPDIIRDIIRQEIQEIRKTHQA